MVRIAIRGFTLVELMVVIAIIGILAGIAYPSYVNYKIRVDRADTQVEMMEISHSLAKFKMANNTYAGRTAQNIYGAATIPRTQPLYDITLTDLNGLALTDASANVRTWLLKATPKSGTRQYGNGVICLNDQGQKFWSKGATTCSLSATSTWE
ncbi:type IV pilin protein [Acinetobacter junii]|uniref:type IV pilin protein n=1 Tax=Acinetobacter junii TaxID=40215 RepID=UPI00100DFB25|nr:prepilin-type N-terminal cleavage/methylation domain-containing protein [Acinetobacter junii]RXS99733.1 prepilin-type N-terminal cleavage/methylation domain-containing protein [Acinetobacter junii]